MPAITPTNTFAALIGPIQLSLLDTNFTQLANAINAIGIVSGTGTVTIGPPASGIGLVVSSSVSASSVSLTNCPGDFIGSANNYVQVDVHNSSNGGSASSDFIATADTGSDTTLFVDVGINSSGFSDATWTISGALDSYLYASDGALTVGTKAAKSISFHTGGTLAANIRGTISSAGNWTINPTGIGNSLNVNVTGGNGVGISAAAAAGAYLFIAGNGAAQGTQGLTLFHDSTGAYLQTNTNDGLAIKTNGTTRLTVSSVGAVSVSGTTSGDTLTVTAAGNNRAIVVQGSGTGTALAVTATATGAGVTIQTPASSSVVALDVVSGASATAPTARFLSNTNGLPPLRLDSNAAAEAYITFFKGNNTGANTLTPTWTNYPGTAGTKNPTSWVPVYLNGGLTLGWIPVFT